MQIENDYAETSEPYLQLHEQGTYGLFSQQKYSAVLDLYDDP